MNHRLRLAALTGPGLLAVLVLAMRSDGRPGPADPASQVQPLTSGPIHEAFAQPGSCSLEPPPPVDQQPPDPVDEEVPDEKPEGDNVQWIGGYWDWVLEQKDFVWVTGIWRIPPPDHQWVATYWTENRSKWQRVPGFWSPFSGEKEQQQISYFPKPPAPEEEDPGEAPEADSQFVPGNWDYGPSGFIWMKGRWIKGGGLWVFIRPFYFWTPGGYVLAKPYWDHRIKDRGRLHPPHRIPPGLRGKGKLKFKPGKHVLNPATLDKNLQKNGGKPSLRIKNLPSVPSNKLPGKTVRVTPQQKTRFKEKDPANPKAVQQRRQLERQAGKLPLTGRRNLTLNLTKPANLTKGRDKRFHPPAAPKPLRTAVVKKTGGTTKKPDLGGKPTKPPRLTASEKKKTGLLTPVRKPELHKPVVKKPAEKKLVHKPAEKKLVHKQIAKKKPTEIKPPVRKTPPVKPPLRKTAVRKPLHKAAHVHKAAPPRKTPPPPRRLPPPRKPPRKH